MNRKSLANAIPSVLLAIALPFAAGPGLPAALAAEVGHASRTPASTEEQVALGRYIVTVSGCNDCHTPFRMGPNGPEPDMSRMLSGHPQEMEMPPAPRLADGPWLVTVAATNTAWSGPWGVSFTANLTPDRETGLGRWTLQNFRETIRTGRHMGRGRPVLPPMPIQMYKHMTDEDLAAVFAYLQSIPAIRNRVPDPLEPAIRTAREGDTDSHGS